MKGKGNKAVSRARKPSLYARVVALVEEARQKVSTVANLAQVYTNYEIGRQIVEEEQGGKRRADYGKQIIVDLSQKLTARFGRGWGTSNLEYMRRFYLIYSTEDSPQTEFGNSGREDLATTSRQIPQFTLGWSRVRRETFGVRRKGMRRETLDARMMGARHETLDASHASRLTSKTPRVSRPAKLAFAPQKGTQP